MEDLVLIATMIAFFLVAALLVKALDKMIGSSAESLAADNSKNGEGLSFGGASLVLRQGTSSILNPGMHGLTEVTYAYASVAQNNGSAFAGLAANTPWYDVTLGLTMLIGRFLPIVLALAIAGSLAGCTPGPGPRWTPPGRRSRRSCSA